MKIRKVVTIFSKTVTVRVYDTIVWNLKFKQGNGTKQNKHDLITGDTMKIEK